MGIKVNQKVLAQLTTSLDTMIGRASSKMTGQRKQLLPFHVRLKNRLEDYHSPAEFLVAAALMNRNKWKSAVVPRVKRFRQVYRRVRTIRDLGKLIGRMSDQDVSGQVLDWGFRAKHERVGLLRGLVKGFENYGKTLRRDRMAVDDCKILRHWAKASDPKSTLEGAAGGTIRGLGPKTVDWLMMFGGDVNTVPADIYTEKALRKLGLGDSGHVAKWVAELYDISPYELDQVFRTAFIGQRGK